MLTPEEIQRVSVQQVSVELDAAHEFVVIRARGQFDIEEKLTIMPFDSFDMIYWQIMSQRLAKKGMIPNGETAAPASGQTPTPKGSGTSPFSLLSGAKQK